MTRKEAIEELKKVDTLDMPARLCKAYWMAINSLEIDERYELEYEQIEPCEDAISKQAVMDCLKKWQPYMATRLWEFEQELSALPSVNPQEPKTGHWIDKGSLSCRCSNCGCKNIKESPYCPWCGAYMKEVEK